MPSSEALPVVLELAGPAAGRIRRHLEGELGWQPVEPDGPVPAPVRIVDVPASLGLATGGPPTWVVVTAQDDPAAAAAAATRLGAVQVVPWPPDDGAFAAAAERLPEASSDHGLPELRVGGAAGGVGCTTVALALAGLGAWAGQDTLVVTHGAVPHPVHGTVDPESLTSPAVGRAARPVRGVARLELLHVSAPAPEVGLHAVDRVVVRDVGTADPAVDVLVLRRDAAGLAAAGDAVAGTLVVSDAGVVPIRAIREAAAGRRVVVVPWSVRVARAAVTGRVPASLPGSWLRALAAATGVRPVHPQDAGGRS